MGACAFRRPIQAIFLHILEFFDGMLSGQTATDVQRRDWLGYWDWDHSRETAHLFLCQRRESKFYIKRAAYLNGCENCRNGVDGRPFILNNIQA